MWCPKCASEKTKVVGVIKATQNERFRRCLKCGYSFVTIEAIKFDNYWKDYAKEVYTSNNKLKSY